uniref:Uncharacterized protein n=1 Tax=Magallana gigas TaxID=29159 RepID=K1RAF0_MAGGI
MVVKVSSIALFCELEEQFLGWNCLCHPLIGLKLFLDAMVTTGTLCPLILFWTSLIHLALLPDVSEKLTILKSCTTNASCHNQRQEYERSCNVEASDWVCVYCCHHDKCNIHIASGTTSPLSPKTYPPSQMAAINPTGAARSSVCKGTLTKVLTALTILFGAATVGLAAYIIYKQVIYKESLTRESLIRRYPGYFWTLEEYYWYSRLLNSSLKDSTVSKYFEKPQLFYMAPLQQVNEEGILRTLFHLLPDAQQFFKVSSCVMRCGDRQMNTNGGTSKSD